jgi:hypothetical protein
MSKAREAYQQTTGPQRIGNLLRARRLEKK